MSSQGSEGLRRITPKPLGVGRQPHGDGVADCPGSTNRHNHFHATIRGCQTPPGAALGNSDDMAYIVLPDRGEAEIGMLAQRASSRYSTYVGK